MRFVAKEREATEKERAAFNSLYEILMKLIIYIDFLYIPFNSLYEIHGITQNVPEEEDLSFQFSL